MKYIKVRFNLGRGNNYMKWKIQYPDGRVEYVSPEETNLLLNKCIVKNNKKIAKKIFDGANKTVCAWILCESVGFTKINYKLTPLSYNPRAAPNWMSDGKIVDEKYFETITTINRKLFVL